MRRSSIMLHANLATTSGTTSKADIVTSAYAIADVHFTVPGTPRPQGSMRAFRKRGKTIVTSDNPKLRPWRASVKECAEIRMLSRDILQCPVDVLLKFYFARPKSVSVRKRPAMTVKPDLDKLIRSVLDSMSGVVYRDDSQVVKVTALKQYTLDGERVEVWVQEALLGISQNCDIQPKARECKWECDDDGLYETECGSIERMSDWLKSRLGARWCPFCGGRIKL